MSAVEAVAIAALALRELPALARILASDRKDARATRLAYARHAEQAKEGEK